jgi:hypothetical protein
MAQDEPTDLAPANKSLVRVKIGSREFSMVRSTRCGVCMHPARFAIEEKMLLNYGYPAITKWISEKDVQSVDGSVESWPSLTVIQLRHHREAGHCPLNAEMVHELSKRRAAQLGVDLENNSGQFVDHVVASKMVLQRSIERLVKGEIEPDVKDLLSVSKLLQDLEAANKQNATQEQMQDLMQVYFTVVKSLVTDEEWIAIMNKLRNHPAVKAFQQKRTIEG